MSRVKADSLLKPKGSKGRCPVCSQIIAEFDPNVVQLPDDSWMHRVHVLDCQGLCAQVMEVYGKWPDWFVENFPLVSSRLLDFIPRYYRDYEEKRRRVNRVRRQTGGKQIAKFHDRFPSQIYPGIYRFVN